MSGLSSAVGALLCTTLLTSGGGSPQAWRPGDTGYAVAQIQADLGVLGFDAGPVTGRVDQRLRQAAQVYVDSFGIGPGVALSEALTRTVMALGTVPTSARGPTILSVQRDLARLQLYHGALSGAWTPTLAASVAAFNAKLGRAPTSALTAVTLAELAHWTAVAVAARHHWTYHAVLGDRWSLLAWVAGLPRSGLENANRAQGPSAIPGSTVVWKLFKPTRPVQPPPSHSSHLKAPSKPSPAPTPSPPPSSSGVFANLDPLADLVWVNPKAQAVEQLLSAESRTGDSIDVAVSGEWALTHSGLVDSLQSFGNQIAVTGYSGISLNRLPKWGIGQELTWGSHALAAVSGEAVNFFFSVQQPNAVVQQACRQDRLIPMHPAVMENGLTPRPASTQRLSAALLQRDDRIVAFSGNVSWSALFRTLKAQHFVFENLAQIWAQG